jgi:CubicO group peptidase (beta-lactamase class C family)
MDYLRFAQMLLNNATLDGGRILSRKTVELMISDQLGLDVRERTTSPALAAGYSFGLGFSVRSQTGRAALAGSTGDFGWEAHSAPIFGSIRKRTWWWSLWQPLPATSAKCFACW